MDQARPVFLVLLTGLPAAGKSTFADALAAELEAIQSCRAMIISSDAVRAEIPALRRGFLPEVEATVRPLTLARVKAAIEAGFPVIHDDLNYYRSMRREGYIVARNLQIPYFLIHMATPYARCLELNAARGHKVPDEVIFTDSGRFDETGLVPWDEPYLVLDDPHKIDAAVRGCACKMLLAGTGRIPPPCLETGPLPRSRQEELEILARRIVGELYRQSGKNKAATDSKALHSRRVELVAEAGEWRLDDGDAKSYFRKQMERFFR